MTRAIMPENAAYAITRFRNIWLQQIAYKKARKKPKVMGAKLLKWAKKELPADTNFARDFTPPYGPWEQRLCLIPDSDMFKAISSGAAEIVTDHIDHFTDKGIMLKSGRTLDADIIITATGLNLVTMGKTRLSIDSHETSVAQHFNYKGVMFSDIPNMASVFGYINASWTLKTDIVADYVCRLLREMDHKGAQIANPKLGDTNMPRLPFVSDFTSGYFARSFDDLPANGDRHPWRVLQDYRAEKKILTKEPIDDGVMVFSKAKVAHRMTDDVQLEAAE
jgi:cation diffusion facilitator CzcD-associated flavoprotein CzcO